MIKAMIVDDEPLARQTIEYLLADQQDVSITHSVGHAPKALQLIAQTPLDLVFLDIKMPGMSGMEILDVLHRAKSKQALPYFVLVTAYDQFAVEAFEFHAIDYLVKPFSDARFYKALEHARSCIAQKKIQPIAALLEGHEGLSSRLAFDEDGALVVLDHAELVRIEAADHYLVVHTQDTTHILRKTMASLQDELGCEFLRIHRSHLVNRRCVQRLSSRAGEPRVVLTDGKELPVSRRKYSEIRQLLKEISL